MKRTLPPKVPAVGDRVKYCRRGILGTLVSVNERDWAKVEWDDGQGPAPVLCHLRELECVENTP